MEARGPTRARDGERRTASREGRGVFTCVTSSYEKGVLVLQQEQKVNYLVSTAFTLLVFLSRAAEVIRLYWSARVRHRVHGDGGGWGSRYQDGTG